MRRTGITLVLGLVLPLILFGCTSPQPSSTQPARATPPPSSSTLVSASNTAQAALPDSQKANQSSTDTQEGQNAGLAVVKSVRANLREHPSLSGAVVEEVRQGDALSLLSRSPVGPWYKVRHRETGSEGWIHGNGIVITRPEGERAASKPQEAVAGGAATTVPGKTTSGRSYTNVDGERVPPRSSARVRQQGQVPGAVTGHIASAAIEGGHAHITAALRSGSEAIFRKQRYIG